VAQAYVWLDDAWQRVNLPKFTLGFQLVTSVGSSHIAPAFSHDQNRDGNVLSGGIGYVLPHGTLPPMFGSNARIEVAGS
jgi:hypothetical protein